MAARSFHQQKSYGNKKFKPNGGKDYSSGKHNKNNSDKDYNWVKTDADFTQTTEGNTHWNVIDGSSMEGKWKIFVIVDL